MADARMKPRGVLIPIEQWRQLTETMVELSARAAFAAEYMIQRCDDFDGDPDIEDDDSLEDDDPAGQIANEDGGA